MIQSALSVLPPHVPSLLDYYWFVGATHSRKDPKDVESFRLQQIWKKKNATRHVPGQHRARVVGLSKSSARRAARRAAGKPAIIRWSNYHKKGSNFTQCSLFFSPGRTMADRDRTGCTWPRKVTRVSIDFHDFSISFSMTSKGRGLSPRPATPPVWQKFDTDARRWCPSRSSVTMISLSLSARDRRHTWPYSHLLPCSLGNKTTPFSKRCPFVITACRHFWQ